MCLGTTKTQHSQIKNKSNEYFLKIWVSVVAQLVKNPPAMQETWVRSLGWEDPLEEDKASHSGILAWRIPRREEPGKLQSMMSQTAGHN